VARGVLGEGLRLAAWGAGLGLVAGAALSHLIRSLLFETSPTDPWTFAQTALVLVIAALLAVLVPALRAARMDPVQALRYD